MLYLYSLNLLCGQTLRLPQAPDRKSACSQSRHAPVEKFPGGCEAPSYGYPPACVSDSVLSLIATAYAGGGRVTTIFFALNDRMRKLKSLSRLPVELYLALSMVRLIQPYTHRHQCSELMVLHDIGLTSQEGTQKKQLSPNGGRASVQRIKLSKPTLVGITRGEQILSESHPAVDEI